MHASQKRGPLGQQATSRLQGGCAVSRSYVLSPDSTRLVPSRDTITPHFAACGGVRWPPQCLLSRFLALEVASAPSEFADVGNSEAPSSLAGHHLIDSGSAVSKAVGDHPAMAVESGRRCVFDRHLRHGCVVVRDIPQIASRQVRVGWWPTP